MSGRRRSLFAGLLTASLLLSPTLLYAQSGKIFQVLKDIPPDGKPHPFKPAPGLKSSKVRIVQFKSVSMNQESADDAWLNLILFSDKNKQGTVWTNLRIEFYTVPKESLSIVKVFMVNPALMDEASRKLIDMRRVGRNWRSLELGNEARTQSVDLTNELKLIMIQPVADERILTTLAHRYKEKGIDKYVAFTFLDLKSFSNFVDWFDDFNDWANKEKGSR